MSSFFSNYLVFFQCLDLRVLPYLSRCQRSPPDWRDNGRGWSDLRPPLVYRSALYAVLCHYHNTRFISCPHKDTDKVGNNIKMQLFSIENRWWYDSQKAEPNGKQCMHFYFTISLTANNNNSLFLVFYLWIFY